MTVIEEYINQVNFSHYAKLMEIYHIIKELVPLAEESLSYGIPTFKVKGNLVHFADHKHHLGFYPGPSAIIAFQSELHEFKQSKGAIQFPYNKTLPVDLIKKIILFRLDENLCKS